MPVHLQHPEPTDGVTFEIELRSGLRDRPRTVYGFDRAGHEADIRVHESSVPTIAFMCMDQRKPCGQITRFKRQAPVCTTSIWAPPTSQHSPLVMSASSGSLTFTESSHGKPGASLGNGATGERNALIGA